MIFVLAILSVSIPTTFAAESFDGTSSIERFPQVIDSDEPKIIEIKFQYHEGPYSLNIEPLFEINPEEAIPFVDIEFEELEGVPRMSVKRMIGTITVDQNIPSEKIFLSISYNGTYSVVPPQPFKSSWNDSLIIDIEKDLVPEPDQDIPVYENCGPGTTLQNGICVVNEQPIKNNSTGIWGPVIEYPSKISPLKQFKSGISIDGIQCKENLVLLQKYNGSPACVKPSSVIDLIKRNWMVTEEIEGYAIDYDGDVKHLPFADICTNEMRIILLTHSNISSPEEHFVMQDVVLPSGMNQEEFETCAVETDFTKSRWNMVSR